MIVHIQNTNSQYNLPPFPKKLTCKGNRTAQIAERFEQQSTKLSIASDLALIGNDTQIAALETHLVRSAKVDDPATFAFLRTVPGIGPIPGLVMLYEIDTIRRLPRGQELPVVLAPGGVHARDQPGRGSAAYGVKAMIAFWASSRILPRARAISTLSLSRNDSRSCWVASAS